MMTASPALVSFLQNARQMALADLYTFTTVSGLVLRYTSAAWPISWGGNTFNNRALRIERGKVTICTSTEVDELEVDVYPTGNDLVGANIFTAAAIQGALDGAMVSLDRGYAPRAGAALVGVVNRFTGTMGPISGGRSKLSMTVKSGLDRLSIQMPRVLFQAPCTHSLYDASCGLSRAAFAVTGAVTVGGSPGFQTNLTQADKYFTQGKIVFTSGPNAGNSFAVRSYAHTNGVVTVFRLGAPAVAGDAFTIYPGCDKTTGANGCTKFNNLSRFRGYPFVPNPETALP